MVVGGQVLGMQLQVEHMLILVPILLILHSPIPIPNPQENPHRPAHTTHKSQYTENSIDSLITICWFGVGEPVELKQAQPDDREKLIF